MEIKRKYGWKPDLPDQRDHYFKVVAPIVELPPVIDLRTGCPAVYDQGQLGSCTANSIAGAHQFEQMKQQEQSFNPARLFIYYNERDMEGTVSEDSGAAIRDGIKSVANLGVCNETEWPYDTSQFTVKPTAQCYTDALNHQVTQYMRVLQVQDQLCGCLAAGYPFVFGFTVYESFESAEVAQTGVAPMPAANEQVLGGHAVMAVGYDLKAKTFLVRNSWGPNWGQGGYFTLPFAYLTDSNLSDDFWTIRLVE